MSINRPPRSPVTNSVATLHNIMVAMRDGAHLATDVYLPARDGALLPGPFPVVLERTPYLKTRNQTNTPDGAFWASRGYVYATQDCRGRHKSGGVFISYPVEGDDGVDTMAWIMKQPWCNGKVAVTGSSYYASTAQAILCRNPPGLAAAAIRVGAGDYHEDGAWSGGAFQLTHNINYALGLAALGKEAQANPAVRRAFEKALETKEAFKLMQRSPLAAGQSVMALAPSYDDWYQEWQNHELYDEYWKQDGYRFDYRNAPDVPILLIGTWYDEFLGGMLDAYTGYAEGKTAPVQMAMGGGFQSSVYTMSTVAGDVDFGPSLPMDVPGMILQWFDQYVKGDDRGLPDGHLFHAFRIESDKGEKTEAGNLQAAGSWQTFPQWPPSDAIAQKFHLSPDYALTTQTSAKGTLSYDHDPANPIPTIGGNVSSGLQIVRAGPADQRGDMTLHQCGDTRPLAERPDVLSFSTAPLIKDTEISGLISVTLFISSTAVDTDFTAKLVDRYPSTPDYPDGYAMNIADGIVRARLRHFTQRGPGYRRLYAQSESPLIPGQITELVIDLWSASVLFKAGHRIRLDIASSNFPRFDVNPNTGEKFAERRLPPITARNTIHMGPDHPSHITLSVRG
jgi:putative CocE/NonD family hydrolase